MSAACSTCEPARPGAVANRPGLPAVAYRVGTYATFRRAMLERIARTPELSRLGTRRSDDFSITLIELWAAVADVLTFYQERYANESFLRTATGRDSVSRLARLLDYDLRPGVAALAHLAYEVERDKSFDLARRSRVASVPGPGERAQTFETLELLHADARLNRLSIVPAPVPTPPFAPATREAALDPARAAELAVALAAGDRIVLFADGTTRDVEEKEVRRVRVEADRAVLEWTQPVQGSAWGADTQAWKVRRSFGLFGQNAPTTFIGASAAPGAPATRFTWTLQKVATGEPASDKLALDGRFERLAVGGRLLVAAAGRTTLVTIQGVAQVERTVGPFTSTVTELTVTPTLSAIADRRTAVVYELVGERPVGFWGSSYPELLTGTTVYLAGSRTGDGVAIGRTIQRGRFVGGVVIRPDELEVGRRLLLVDDRQTVPARIAAAPSLVPAAAAVGDVCSLAVPVTPDEPLALETRTAALVGNVVLASHGETVAGETLGSGDASQRFQRFQLARTPLTLVPAATPPGTASTLEVLVDGVRWEETRSLHGRGPADRVYTLRSTADGTSSIQFGDGLNGARLLTGRDNVRATYRSGSGLAGRVGRGQLTGALDRPTGLLGVTNPLAAEGGADPEATDDARRNAPTSVRTFGRAVSLRDVEDLARASGEVAKAQATWVWDGHGRAVHLTVVAQGGGELGRESLRRLRASLDAARDRNHRLRLASVRRVAVIVRAVVTVAPDRVRPDVGTAATSALLDALSFERQDFGRALRLGDVFAALQDVAGVSSVDVDALTFKDPAELGPRGATSAAVQPFLRIDRARPDPSHRGRVLPAEMAWVESPGQDVTVTAVGGLAG